MTRAMIVVDVQNDFCEGGSLAVAGGTEISWRIANAINEYKRGDWNDSTMFQYFVATKDFHIQGDSNDGHISDNPDYVNTWPGHCFQGTEGARFAPAIQTVADDFDAIFYKGMGRADYSGFQGQTVPAYPDQHGQYMGAWLAERGVTHLTVVGIAADYCVRQTAIDGIVAGFNVFVPYDLTVAVGGQEAVQRVCTEVRQTQQRFDNGVG